MRYSTQSFSETENKQKICTWCELEVKELDLKNGKLVLIADC